MTAVEPFIRAISYEVSVLPDGFPDGDAWTVYVEYRGDGKWAVKRHAKCLAVDGTWSYGAGEDEDREEWLARHRHDLSSAFALARQAARTVTVGGVTAEQAWERERAGSSWTKGSSS